MPALTFVLPFRPVFDSNSRAIAGAQIWFTLTGTNTPAAVYSDAGLTTPLTNPVVADGVGALPAIYLDSAVTYRVRMYAADAEVGVDSPLEEYDPYSLNGSTFPGYANVKWFGAEGDSNASASTGTDDTAAIQAALDYLDDLGGGALYVPEGYYKITAYLTVPKNVRIIGAGRNVSTLVTAMAGGGGANLAENVRNGSVFYSNWASNNATAVHIAIEHLGVRCANAANVGAALYDNGGSFVHPRDCYFYGFKYGVIFDQTECSDISECIIEPANNSGACVWFVNGALLKAGNLTGYTNRLGVHYCQLGGGATVDLIRDDGGYSHVFTSNNYNGGLHHLRLAAATAFSVINGEYEGATSNPILLSTTASDGATTVGYSFGNVSGGLIMPGSGPVSPVQVSGTAVVSFESVAFTGAATYPVSGATDCRLFFRNCSTERSDGVFTDTTLCEIYDPRTPLPIKSNFGSAAFNLNADFLNGITRCSTACAVTILADASLSAPIGAVAILEQDHVSGAASFVAGAGATITGPLTTTAQYQQLVATKVAANTWQTQLVVPNPLALRPTESHIIVASDETTALTAGTAKATFRMPYAFTLTGVRASLSTAQVGGSIFTVDVNEAGTTLLSTKLTIDNGEKTSTTAATPPVISDAALADDAEITVDIDQVGDGTAKGLKVVLVGARV